MRGVNYAMFDQTVLFRAGEDTRLLAALAHNVMEFEGRPGDALYHEGRAHQWTRKPEIVVGPVSTGRSGLE